MLFSTLATACVLVATTANAMPWPAPPQYTPARDLSKLAKLFPQSALPAPSGVQLKYVLLGIGTQNYTCTTGDDTAAPGTTGALATLYDIGTKLNDDFLAKWKIPSLSSLALSLSSQPKALDVNLRSQGYEHVIGHHFFAKIAEVNTPMFALDQLVTAASQTYPIAKVSKLNETDAPVSACPGNNGLPAIKWLYLKDTKGISQGNIDTVYRVETAGGNKPATCKDMPPTWEVKYAAQYWIFGPK